MTETDNGEEQIFEEAIDEGDNLARHTVRDETDDAEE